MMTQIRLKRLLISYCEGTINPWEFEELTTFLQKNSDTDEVASVMDEVTEMVEGIRQPKVPSQEIFERIIDDFRYKAERTKKKDRRAFSRKLALAATAVVAISLSLVFYVLQSDKAVRGIPEASQDVFTKPFSTTLPGKKQAMLTLSDGSKVSLDSLEGRTIATPNGVYLSMKDGLLAYKTDDQMIGPIQHIVTTPLGGEYQIVLSDGTKVWMNAESSITFPIVFMENYREVEISGEVYFEVQKDEQIPFIVIAEDIRVSVLGTAFNVRAYGDERGTKTTLLEGSVRVEKGEAVHVLKPGQQAQTTNVQQGIEVYNADVEEAVAWKNGFFLFNNERVYDAMKKISKWYNVDVVYEGEVPDKGLDGTISRMEDLRQLLSALEITGAARFELKGRRIIVKE